MRAPIDAVLWDLDGLLTDTETLHLRAYREAFAARGHALSDDDYARIWIQGGGGLADYLAEAGLDWDDTELRADKHVRYDALVRAEVKTMPGAMELLTALHGRKQQALASSAWRHSVGAVMDALVLHRFLKVSVCGDEVERVKPAPDIFLEAARRLEVPPERCLVLEDAEKGVAAARAAGMRVLAVPTHHTAGNDFSRATEVVDSLELVDEAFIDRLELPVPPPRTPPPTRTPPAGPACG